jgi:teichuronic acid biosynthesis glycosyltransferase TuaG
METPQLPSVSVVMPAYKAEHQISASINSVLAQSFTNWELIIVDDCSPDATVEVVKAWTERDPRIRLVRMSQNLGPAKARNMGIAQAKGRFIAFLDSDDLWLPEKLKVQIKAMEAQAAPFSCTSYRVFKGGHPDRTVSVPKWITLKRMLQGSVIGCLTVVYDSQALGKKYFPDLDALINGSIWESRFSHILHEDYALWIDILNLRSTSGEPMLCLGVKDVLAHYNDNAHSFSSNKTRAALSQWIIYRRHIKLDLLRSVYYFVRYATAGLLRRRRNTRGKS